MPEQPEFSRLIAFDRLVGARSSQHLEARPGERAALARRFGLLGLDRLEATVEIRPGRSKDLLRVSGHWTADVTQRCVITLEPVAAHLEQPIDLLFSLAPPPETSEVVLDPDEADWPEPVPREGLDVGEVVAQLLSLALDPYPRRRGATLETALEEAGLSPDEGRGEPAEAGPFAVLAELRSRAKGRKGNG